MTVQAVLYFIATLIAAGTVLGSHWKYQDEDHWPSQCHEGKYQSPIALASSIAREKEFHHFKLRGYAQAVEATLKNNGHSAEVRLNITEDQKPEISGGGLEGKYQLDHLHFHWESEHVMETYRFPLELHLVHYEKKYGNLGNALQYPRGVAVFAVLFDISPDDDEEFVPLLDIIATLQHKLNEPMTLKNFVVKNFLPRNLAGFYRYEGSLTTPKCNEGILWTVFTNTIPISQNQVNIFKDIQTNDNTVLKANYRSLQPLHDRDVYLKVSPLRHPVSSAKTNQASYLLVSSVVVMYCLMKY